MKPLIEEGKMTVEKAEQILNSWLGHAKHGSSRNFIQSLIKRNDYIYLKKVGKREILKVDKTKLNVELEGENIDFL